MSGLRELCHHQASIRSRGALRLRKPKFRHVPGNIKHAHTITDPYKENEAYRLDELMRVDATAINLDCRTTD